MAIPMDDIERQRRRLITLLRNLPGSDRINREPWVREFHARLWDLRRANFKVRGFWIRPYHIARVPDGDQPESVERAFFVARLEALITCLELPTETRPIGFRTSQ